MKQNNFHNGTRRDQFKGNVPTSRRLPIVGHNELGLALNSGRVKSGANQYRTRHNVGGKLPPG